MPSDTVSGIYFFIKLKTERLRSRCPAWGLSCTVTGTKMLSREGVASCTHLSPAQERGPEAVVPNTDLPQARMQVIPSP